jgi:hypothetical protein
MLFTWALDEKSPDGLKERVSLRTLVMLPDGLVIERAFQNKNIEIQRIKYSLFNAAVKDKAHLGQGILGVIAKPPSKAKKKPRGVLPAGL